jgi:short-subunit dehydrogenase
VKSVVILGATRGMGRALARALTARGDRVFLLGRNADELSRGARDLEARGSTSGVGFAVCDLEHPETFEPSLDAAQAHLGSIDVVIVTAGLFATQETLERDRELMARLLTVNFTNTIRFCETARERLLASGGGTLCVFSSVAGERGRKPVVLYGAAKAGLTRYLEGLDARYHSRGLTVVCIKPGFVRTSMTSGLKEPPFAADADDVVPAVLRAIDRGSAVAYAPAIWRMIMAIIRLLPRAVLRRAEF